MPKRIKVRDKKPIYYAYRLGETNGITKYGAVLTADVQFVSVNSSLSSNPYGEQLPYTDIALFEFNDKTMFIDNFTKIWFGVKPTNSDTPANFEIHHLGQIDKGLFTVYLNSVTQNHRSLWYLFKDVIYETELLLESTGDGKWLGKTPLNMYLPIDSTTKIWLTQPENEDTTFDRVKLKNRKCMPDGVYLSFEEVPQPEPEPTENE